MKQRHARRGQALVEFALVIIVFLVCFFPILLNGILAFTSLSVELARFCASTGAGPLKTFFKVRLPAALPPTPYARFGDGGFAALWLAGAGLLARRRRRLHRWIPRSRRSRRHRGAAASPRAPPRARPRR